MARQRQRSKLSEHANGRGRSVHRPCARLCSKLYRVRVCWRSGHLETGSRGKSVNFLTQHLQNLPTIIPTERGTERRRGGERKGDRQVDILKRRASGGGLDGEAPCRRPMPSCDDPTLEVPYVGASHVVGCCLWM